MNLKGKEIIKTDNFTFYKASVLEELELPFAESYVVAGFPSPAEDFKEGSIDLNKVLIKNPAATYYAKVNGVSMTEMGIDEGDLLIIDKSLEATDGAIAICVLDGEFTVKMLKIQDDKITLVPGNPKFKPIEIQPETDFMVWGIVVHVVKSF